MRAAGRAGGAPPARQPARPRPGVRRRRSPGERRRRRKTAPRPAPAPSGAAPGRPSSPSPGSRWPRRCCCSRGRGATTIACTATWPSTRRPRWRVTPRPRCSSSPPAAAIAHASGLTPIDPGTSGPVEVLTATWRSSRSRPVRDGYGRASVRWRRGGRGDAADPPPSRRTRSRAAGGGGLAAVAGGCLRLVRAVGGPGGSAGDRAGVRGVASRVRR